MMLGMVLPWGAERLLMISGVFPGCDTEGADAEVRKWRTGEQSDHETFFKFLSEWAAD